MILDIVKYGDPVLRQKGRPVAQITDELRSLAADMIETMHEANGVGLAAQQVGVPIQFTVLEVSDSDDRPSTMSVDGKPAILADWMPLVIMNPVLELSRDKETGSEGCLSFPEITADIERSSSVKAKALLLDGRQIQFEATGLLARALQHEADHLNGILFIDRMNSATKTAIKSKLKRLQRETVAMGR